MTRTFLILSVVVPLVGAAGVLPAAAQKEELGQCRSISDSLERLTCYDGIQLSDGFAQPKAGEFRKISLDDFKVDQRSLQGQKVELQGELTLFGEMLMLQDGQMDMSPILIEFSDLPRDQRLRIVQRCGIGCGATVRGEVDEVFFQVGVTATSILVE